MSDSTPFDAESSVESSQRFAPNLTPKYLGWNFDKKDTDPIGDAVKYFKRKHGYDPKLCLILTADFSPDLLTSHGMDVIHDSGMTPRHVFVRLEKTLDAVGP